MSDEADGMGIYGDLPDAFTLVESAQVGPLPPIRLTGKERIVVAEPEGLVAVPAPGDGLAWRDLDAEAVDRLKAFPGYDPDADLVLVSKAGQMQWVPLETCP